MLRTDRQDLQAVQSLVLQPHRDDAVMNAAILLLAGMIPLPAAIVSVFSRSSHLVRPLPARSIREVSEIRKREDVLAWRGFPGVHLVDGMGFLDLPDRGPSSDGAFLTFQVERAIQRLVVELGITFLVVQYAARPDAHPDHQVVFRAAVRAVSELPNVSLLLTQDAPYSVMAPGHAELLDLGYRRVHLPLSARALGRKHRAMDDYVSQMRPGFHAFVDRNPWEALWLPTAQHGMGGETYAHALAALS